MHRESQKPIHYCIVKRDSGSSLSFFFLSSRRRHTRCSRDWSSDVCSSDLYFQFSIADDLRGHYGAWDKSFRSQITVVNDSGHSLRELCVHGLGWQMRSDSLNQRSEERRVGKEGRSRWSPFH